jgi:metal-responsive CopG/Arc/MetJ family transcriptional regulator
MAGKRKTKSRRIAMLMPEDMLQEIDCLSDSVGVSRTVLIRLAVRKFLDLKIKTVELTDLN